ncbi:MAG TPA: hypothetical protein VG125_09080 [Pirellulales bacterium]|nr:hypothetical protein [Pirellulales bacterium]
MLAVEGQDLVEDGMGRLQARMPQGMDAGHDGDGEAAEGLGDLDADPSWVFR